MRKHLIPLLLVCLLVPQADVVAQRKEYRADLITAAQLKDYSKRISTELGDLVEKVNARYLQLKLNYKYDAPNDPERFYFRSDHYLYAQKGVPIAFYFTGVHEDYHQVSDHVEKIDFTKMERIARTIYATLWELAQRKQRPKVDQKTGE